MKSLLLAAAMLANLLLAPRALSAQIGETAPPLRGLRLLESGNTQTFDTLEGKVTVIDFWATWCGPCVESIPHWNELVQQFSAKSVQFLAITAENEQVVKRFLKRTPIQSTVGIEGPGASLRDLYGVRGIPTAFLVNREGNIAAITHPIRLKREHIDEVLQTGKSSLPRVEEPPAGPDATMVDVNAVPPLLELSIKQSGPRVPGRGYDMWSGNEERTEFEGEHVSVESAIRNLFGARKSLLELQTALPAGDYDFKIRLPHIAESEREELFRALIQSTFGLRIARKTALRDVWIARTIRTNAPGLSAPVSGGIGGGGNAPGQIDLRRGKVKWVLGYFEEWIRKPIIDETGLTNQFDIHLRWEISKAELGLMNADREVVRALSSNDPAAEARLNAEQKRVFRAMKGDLPEAELASFTPEEREEFRLIALELAKPEEERFYTFRIDLD